MDAGPHPNRADAGWGRRLRRLDPDPVTAPHVEWMFEQRLSGRSVASIARELNERGVPCPSHVDPERNRHRTGEAWTLRTVAVILRNPRYTGRQVWNRQRTDREGRRRVRRTNPSAAWVVSGSVAHPALVSETDFVAVQGIRAVRPTTDGTTRTYLLAGMVRCGVCGRRMDSHWVNRRAGYRCRHGHDSARTRVPDQPRNVYIREDILLDGLTARLADHSIDIDRDADGGVRAVASLLRARSVVIVCHETGWDLAPEAHAQRRAFRQRYSLPPRPGAMG
ncbi:MAG: recombinase family protein [Pseudonocardia sp.]